MQRAGGVQDGPSLGSHVAPSSAFATHVDLSVTPLVTHAPAVHIVPVPQRAPTEAVA
jgi:hypothetical protein